jgi:hypothetical protein
VAAAAKVRQNSRRFWILKNKDRKCEKSVRPREAELVEKVRHISKKLLKKLFLGEYKY